MKRKGNVRVLLSVMLTAAILTGCGKQAGYGGEGHFKDACLNEAYNEEEMLNVKGEKVDGESGFEKDFSNVEKIGTLEGKNYYFAYNDELPREGQERN